MSDFGEKLLNDRKRHEPYRRRMALKKRLLSYADTINCKPDKWTALQVMQFMHNWEESHKNLARVKTVLAKFTLIETVFDSEHWTKTFKNGSEFEELKAVYMKRRKLRATEDLEVKQANPIQTDLAAKIVSFLLSERSSTEWQQQYRIVRILSLVFTVIGGCRVKDLFHVKWGDIQQTEIAGHSVILAKLCRSKTDPTGKRLNFRAFPATKGLGIFCPVLLWNRLNKYLPRSDKCYGPFVNMRTGYSFDTATIVEGWRRVARTLGYQDDFSAHSGRRTCITGMLDAGLDIELINTVLGYRKNSKMVPWYDIKKRFAQNVPAIDLPVDSEDDTETDPLANLARFWNDR